MTFLRLAAATAVVCLIAACSSSGTTGPQTGTVAGTVSSSLGQVLPNVTVTVTPTGQAALAAVQTTNNGSYSVANVPVGGGAVAVTGVPSNCTAATATFSGLTANGTQTVDIKVTCQLVTGTLTGTITSSATNQGIASVTVTVTPAGASALPAVQTNTQGQYTVPNVPAGNGQIALSNLPTGCTTPAPGNFGIGAGQTGTVNINVTCSTTTTGSTTTLSVGQTALFTTSPEFATNLTIAGNNVYLIAIINTDSASSAMEDVTVSGAFTASSASRVGPLRLAARAQPPVRPTPFSKLLRRNRVAASRPRLDPQFERDLRYLRVAQQGHLAKMEQDARTVQRLGRPRFGTQSAIRESLVNSQIGDVNAINVPVPSCSNFATIGARTVYAGPHVQILADTSLTNWPAQYRPDSSYYTTLGLEYDTLTYAKHLLTYIGDPLEYDAQYLQGVGKVTIVLTPVLNGESTSGTQGGGTILAFVSPCDFYLPSQSPDVASSNHTEMIYHLVPSANFSLAFWEREIRPTLAHESKHIVSIGEHLVNAPFLEQVWLEEGLAQISSEIWGRNYNTATWKGDAGFAATLGCEITGVAEACNTPTSPYTFVDSHMGWLEQYLQTQDSVAQSLNGTTPGRYGAGWSIARWAIDQSTTGTSPSTEATTIKALIQDYTATGLQNIANVTGFAPEQTLAYWNLAVGLDTVSLLDSATYDAGVDPRAIVPSFDYRNIFSVAGNDGVYPLAAPLRPGIVQVGNIDVTATGILGTDAIYLEVVGGSTPGTQSLQLLSGSGGAISSSSGFRVAIVRIQ